MNADVCGVYWEYHCGLVLGGEVSKHPNISESHESQVVGQKKTK